MVFTKVCLNTMGFRNLFSAHSWIGFQKYGTMWRLSLPTFCQPLQIASLGQAKRQHVGFLKMLLDTVDKTSPTTTFTRPHSSENQFNCLVLSVKWHQKYLHNTQHSIVQLHWMQALIPFGNGRVNEQHPVLSAQPHGREYTGHSVERPAILIIRTSRLVVTGVLHAAIDRMLFSTIIAFGIRSRQVGCVAVVFSSRSMVSLVYDSFVVLDECHFTDLQFQISTLSRDYCLGLG